MECSARVLEITTTHDGKFTALIQLNGKTPKKDELIRCRWGRKRSKGQNAVYWCLLAWLCENGMEDMGYRTKEDIHEAMKGRFLMKKVTDDNGITFYKECSTTDLTTDEFTKYMDKVEKTVQEYCGISCAGFWMEYGEREGG